jgi:hypothetical protein
VSGEDGVDARTLERHSIPSVGGDSVPMNWIPACAGMTNSSTKEAVSMKPRLIW